MTLAIIGGTGLTKMSALTLTGQQTLTTPYGSPSADYVFGEMKGKKIIFLARHGNPHVIPPHKINYRANIWGLKELGVTQIIAAAAVGGITSAMSPAHLAIPDQIIDYTYGREQTFFSENLTEVTHIDFSYPYSENLRRELIESAANLDLEISPIATYGCTQGPRLESSAEIRRMQNDGCDIVGMTAMPEAALARELGLDYAAIAVVANWAAGKIAGEITMAQIEQYVAEGMTNVVKLLEELMRIKN